MARSSGASLSLLQLTKTFLPWTNTSIIFLFPFCLFNVFTLSWFQSHHELKPLDICEFPFTSKQMEVTTIRVSCTYKHDNLIHHHDLSGVHQPLPLQAGWISSYATSPCAETLRICSRYFNLALDVVVLNLYLFQIIHTWILLPKFLHLKTLLSGTHVLRANPKWKSFKLGLAIQILANLGKLISSFTFFRPFSPSLPADPRAEHAPQCLL